MTSADWGGNRRIRKKLATRQALEEAALRLFAERGYEGTTVEEIAEAAGVAERTFFRYFASKQHILLGDVAQGRIAALRTALWGRPEGEPVLDSIDTVLEGLDLADPEDRRQILERLRLLRTQPGLLGTYLLLNRDLAGVVAEFAAARTPGMVVTDLYPQLVAAATSGAWDTALVAWLASDGQDDLGDLRRAAFAALTAGLRGGDPRIDPARS
ncbi:TetR family transcriptional regulator [Hamadaea tsunoensis]|uniref:TetR family transcriptional regulator n=1 Tax=Hamadaea tsunoensis TaxID=53368 RepID=UPI0003F86711|nr:TetR family transcriptional regulator [Hamadaea tsunoensis]